VPSRPLGSGVELESQVVQLRNCLETLERRLEEELRSFLAISDKRLQVREEQLRGVGETLQASADAALEQLGRRVDVRLRELERAGMAPMALDEVWDCIKRLQNDCQDLDSKLRRATSTDEIAERFQEMERAQAQRLEDRLATQERRLSDYRVQLQGSNREFLQAIEHRCEMLEKNFWEGQSDRGDVVEAVFKRLAEAAPIRELHDEKINSSNYDKEVQRSRLAAAEAKLSKFAALESKVDFMESQMSQQLEEQAQQFRNVGELQQRLVQKLSATEASCQRVEAQGSVLQAKLQAQMEEDRDRHSSSFESMQLRLVQRLEEEQRMRDDEQRRKEADEKNRKEAEEARIKEAEEAEAEEKKRKEAEAQKKREAEEQMRKEAEEQERREAMEAEEQRKRQEAEEAEEARQAQQKAQEAKQKQLEAARAAAGVVQPKEHTPTSQAGAPKPGFEKRRARVTGLPPTARASARSKEEEIKKVFAAIDTTSSGALTLDDLQSFLCDFLGFGQAEVAAFHQRFGEGDAMSLEGFKKGYASLNPFTLTKRHKELIIRKSGSLSSAGLQALQLEELEDSEVYVCELTNTAYVDVCKRCAILIGPSETSVFVRDCEDCVFWIAAQQLRTRDCKRCSFFLYSKTEPVIESSEDLAFAPWSASYPCSKAHFEKLGFNPEKNLWNAIYDFSGKVGKCNWRILGLEETARLQIELEDPPPKPEPENPAAPLTYEALCAEPLESGESCGTSVGQIPQTRPALPAAPPMDFKEVQQIVVQDGGKLAALEQLVRLRRKDSSSQPSTPGALAMATLAGKTLMKAGGGSAEMEAVAKATPASASSALGMARLAGQTLMEAGGGSAETEAVAKATPASASSALGMARLAGQTLMEAGGGSAETEAVAKATPASASSALGMARLAGQTLMEAGTTVHGTMAVEEEDSSGDSPRPAPSKAPKPAAKPAAKPDAAQVRKLLGESSDEESEEAKPSTAPSASAALPKLSLGKAMPKPAVNRAHPVAVDSEEDDDSDIEEAMKKAAAAASASRTSPLGGSSAAKSAPTSLRLSPQSRAEASVPVVDDEDDDSGNDFDEDIDLPM
ncbi:unnamed protein product, partial [Effrenium voratum]